MIKYFMENPIYLVVLIVALVAIVATVISMVCVSIKRKNNDVIAEQRKAEEETKAAAEKQAKAENEAARKKALWEKLDAELEEANKEKQAVENKPAKKSTKKKATPVAEETAVTEEKKEEVKEEPTPAPVEEAKVEKKKATPKKAKKVEEPAPVEEKKEEVKEEPTPAPVEEAKVEKKKAAPKKTKKVEEPAPVEEKKEEVKEEPTPAPVEEAKVEKKKTAPKKAKKVEESAPVEEKKEAPAPAEEDETAVLARYAGKWIIYHILTDENNPDDEMYFFELHASNGEKLFSSEEYTSYNGAIKGIDTYKANIAKDNFKITMTKKGDYIFKIMSGKNTLLCNGENYATKVRCESAMKSTKRFAKTAFIDDKVRDVIVPVPTETDTEVPPVAEGVTGKWLISSRDVDGDKAYYFELFANNSEKLLSSEEYTTYIGAVNGLQTHKQNIAKGNFRISLTKNGDYIYKLLNGNNQLLCLGEHYKTKARCESAVESVKRFAANSPTLTDSDHIEE